MTDIAETKSDFQKREELIDGTISCLNQSLLAGTIPDANFIAEMIHGQPSAKVSDWPKKHTDISSKDFDRALRLTRIKIDLGGVPGYAAELVETIVKRDRMTCLYNGQITTDTVPMIDGMHVTKDDLKIDVVSDKVHFSCPSKVNLDAFQRQLRMITDKHRLMITREAINDAVVDWVEIRRRDRRYDLFSEIRGPISNVETRAKVETLWLDVARKLFVCTDEMPAEFIAAVLKKFIHQVKRKLRGLPVYDHLMPVILGTQGKGKSTFVRAMLNPIRELVLAVDFKMIEDDRNIDIWNSYVLFIDEMGFASKANIDTIKNAITAETLTRKPLYTNSKVEIDQSATFFGCSNKELEQLIKDPTGIRRFLAVRYSNNPDWAFLNGIDWKLLWQSVDHEGPDPMAGFKSTLVEAQEATREMGRVEEWLVDLDVSAHPSLKIATDQKDRISAKTLYELFREYEEEFHPGSVKTSLTEWGNEMRRMEKSGQNTRFAWLGKLSGRVLYKFIR